MFVLLFIYNLTLNWICFRELNIFVHFLWICFGERVLFSPTAANIDDEWFLFGASLEFPANFFWGHWLWGLVERRESIANRDRKRCSENMQQIYRRTPMRKCDFNNVPLQLYWNRTSAWVFSCKFAAYFQNTFF